MLEYLRPRWQRLLAPRYPVIEPFSQAHDEGDWQAWVDPSGMLKGSENLRLLSTDQVIGVESIGFRCSPVSPETKAVRIDWEDEVEGIPLGTLHSQIWFYTVKSDCFHDYHLLYLLDGSVAVFSPQAVMIAREFGRPLVTTIYRLPNPIMQVCPVLNNGCIEQMVLLTENGQVWTIKQGVPKPLKVSDAFGLFSFNDRYEVYGATPRGLEKVW